MGPPSKGHSNVGKLSPLQPSASSRVTRSCLLPEVPGKDAVTVHRIQVRKQNKNSKSGLHNMYDLKNKWETKPLMEARNRTHDKVGYTISVTFYFSQKKKKRSEASYATH